MKKIILTLFATALVTTPVLAQDKVDAAAATAGQPEASTTEQADKPAATPDAEAPATTADSAAEKPAAPEGAESGEGAAADKPAGDVPQKRS
jgi:hypothetical protein